MFISKIIAIDLGKQQALSTKCWYKSNQQYNVTENVDRAGNATMFFITEKVKETIVDFLWETLTVLWTFALEWF